MTYNTSKAVLISIRPKWCEKIASGEKTIEVRKTKPKLKPPFRCFIYETQGFTDTTRADEDGHLIFFRGRGVVIGEFVCDAIFDFSTKVYLGDKQTVSDEDIVNYSCVPRQDLRKYEGNAFGLYGWHISELKIYDEPKPLHEFGMNRPPVSWCYVDEVS